MNTRGILFVTVSLAMAEFSGSCGEKTAEADMKRLSGKTAVEWPHGFAVLLRNRSGRLQRAGRTRTGTSGHFLRSQEVMNAYFTTPYVVVDPDFDEWLAYFRPNAPATDGFADYEGHMKYGPTRQYWNDYVFEINVNVTRTHPPARPQTADSTPRNPDTGTTGKLHDPPRSRPPPADDIARTRSRNARRH
jgi:hypothetical protein